VKGEFSALQRALMWALTRVAYAMYGGTSVPVMEEGFRTLGTAGYFRFLKVAFKITTELQKEYGDYLAQYLIGIAAMWLGCSFCGYNHVMGGVLIYFQETGELHPLTPSSMSKLYDMRDEEAVARIEELLVDPRHDRLRGLIVRMYRLYKNEAQVETLDDRLMESCLWVWRWTTECSIVEGVDMEPEQAWPIHEVGRDEALIQRYKDAIAKSGSGE